MKNLLNSYLVKWYWQRHLLWVWEETVPCRSLLVAHRSLHLWTSTGDLEKTSNIYENYQNCQLLSSSSDYMNTRLRQRSAKNETLPTKVVIFRPVPGCRSSNAWGLPEKSIHTGRTTREVRLQNTVTTGIRLLRERTRGADRSRSGGISAGCDWALKP